MPNLGRWMAIDPLAEKHPDWTPYNYVLANPLKFIDPDGRQVSRLGGDPTLGASGYYQVSRDPVMRRNQMIAGGVGLAALTGGAGAVYVGATGAGFGLAEIATWARSLWYVPAAGPLLTKGTEFATEMVCPGCSGKSITSGLSAGLRFPGHVDGVDLSPIRMGLHQAWKAVSNHRRWDHTIRHLVEEGIVEGALNSDVARIHARQVLSDVLQNATLTFEYYLNGALTKGYYHVQDGKGIVAFVAQNNTGSVNAGQVLGTWVPSWERNPDIMQIIQDYVQR